MGGASSKWEIKTAGEMAGGLVHPSRKGNSHIFYHVSKEAVELRQKRERKKKSIKFLKDICREVDNVPDLKDSGIILKLPHDRNEIKIRHAKKERYCSSRYVKITMTMDVKRNNKSFWQKNRDVILSCGSATVGIVATSVSCAATPFTAGTAGGICVVAWAGTGASMAQCTLSTLKNQIPVFDEFVKTENGKEVRALEIILDGFSLAADFISLKGLITGTAKTFKTTKYLIVLNKTTKGKLLKTLKKLDKLYKDLGDLVPYLKKGLKSTNPAKKHELTSNIIKRMLPKVAKTIEREWIVNLSSALGTIIDVYSSAEGGIISKFKFEVWEVFEH